MGQTDEIKEKPYAKRDGGKRDGGVSEQDSSSKEKIEEHFHFYKLKKDKYDPRAIEIAEEFVEKRHSNAFFDKDRTNVKGNPSLNSPIHSRQVEKKITGENFSKKIFSSQTKDLKERWGEILKDGNSEKDFLEENIDLVNSVINYRWYQMAVDLAENISNQRVRKGRLAFHDFSVLFERLLKMPEVKQKIIEQYQHVLIDEAQDLDEEQFLIFEDIFGNENQTITLIGDPKQSIYRFRRSSVDSFLYRIKKTPRERITQLDINYRADEKNDLCYFSSLQRQ